MNTDTQHNDRTDGIGPRMNRRQLIKTVGAGAGVAAVGTGVYNPQLPHVGEFSPVGESKAAVPLVAYGVSVAGAMAGGYILGQTTDLLGGSDVDEDLNTETFVYQVANTIHDTRSGATGQITELQQEFVNAPQGQSSFAEAAGDAVVSAAALKTLEGNSDEAESEALDRINQHATRSMVNLLETWNSALLRMVESGALVEDYEQGTNIIRAGDSDYNGPLKPTPQGYSNMDQTNLEPVEGSSLEGDDGYLVYKCEIPDADMPYPTTNLEGRDQPLYVYALSCEHNFDGSDPTLYAPTPYENKSWFQNFNNYDDTRTREIRTFTDDFDDFILLKTNDVYGDVITQIQNEYDSLLNDYSAVVDETVQGLEQGDINPAAILDSGDLLRDFDPNNRRSQLAREMMAIGAEMPGEVGSQALISHPDLAADQLWVDLYLRLDTSSDLTIDGPMTVPASDYRMAWIGYQGQTSGEYQQEVLKGNSDLEILEIQVKDQVVEEPNVSVESGGTVRLAPTESESTPTPLAEPDPQYDEWGLVVTAGDGSTSKQTVGEAYLKEVDGEEYWHVDTSLDEGLAVESVRYTPPTTYNNTSMWTPGGTTYDIETTKDTITLRRELNEAIEEEFDSVFGGGGGFFDGGIPTLPGLGVIESAVVVFLAIAGLNAASG